MQFLLRRDNNAFTFWTDRGAGYTNISTGNIVQYNTWQHVAGVWDGSAGTMKIYVNGVLQGTTSVPGTALIFNNNPVYLGWNAINEQMAGNLDEVRVWTRALCQGEIQNNMNCEIPTTGTGLLANYHFNQGIAASNNAAVTTLTDVSGNNYTGTLQSFTLNGATSNWITPGGVAMGTSCGAFSNGISFSTHPANTSVCVGANTTLTIASSGATSWQWQVNTGAGFVNLTNTPPYSGATTQTLTITGATSGMNGYIYRCIATSASQCSSNSNSATLTVNPLPTAAIAGTNTICAGQSTTLTASGGGTYSWSTGATTAAITVSPANTTVYTCTVTSAAGCSSTATRTVTVNPLPTPAISGVITICNGQSTTLTASGGGTYTWSTGATTAVITVSPANTTVYTCTVTSAAGCSATATRTVTVNPLPTPTISGVSTICVGQSTTLTASGGVNYIWSKGATTSAITVSPVSNAVYTCTVTSAAGCSATASSTVTVNPLPVVTAFAMDGVLCLGQSDMLMASGASTYLWSSGGTGANETVTPTSTTTYTVTGTSAAGCSNTATVFVTVNPLPTVTATAANAAICIGGNTTLTANGASTYTLSSGGNSATEIVAPTTNSTYTVTGTDANGCQNTATVSVNVNALPSVTATASNGTICIGATETLTASGASTYAWSSGGTAAIETVTPSATTIYTVTGTDANGCQNTATVTVNVNALPIVTATAASGTICDGATETLTAVGASTYVWSSGGTAATETVTPNTTTTYTLTGTDANGCVNTATVTVDVNALPNVIATANAGTVCLGTSDTLNASGAVSYVWSSGGTATQEIVTPTGLTVYTVTGTDANGCSNTATVQVFVNSLPVVTLGADVQQCGGTVTLDAQNTGATYIWNDNSMMQTLVVNASGTYYVAVTDPNGCSGSDTITVTINTIPTVTGSAASTTVCLDDADVALTGTPANGVWSGPGVTGNNFDPSVGAGAQNLVYSFTDANGCSSSDTVTVTVNACVGFEEATLAAGVNLYPNPNNGTFTLAINANVGDVLVEVMDMQGRVVFRSNENNVQSGFNKQISLENQAAGVYMVRLTSEKEQHLMKVSVEK
ncbi:MAG: hypothetical protein Fur0041_12150 [Bacteroidia bacterium]